MLREPYDGGTRGPANQIHLRRLPVADALFRLDRYLDEAFVAGLLSVRVVHGKGSGVMRAAVHEALAAHPLVAGFRGGHIGEGDDGVTVVELADRWSEQREATSN